MNGQIKFFVICEDSVSDMGQICQALADRDCAADVCLRKGENAYLPAFTHGEYGGLIVLGSAEGVDDAKEKNWIGHALTHNVAVLGICHGAQLLACVRRSKSSFHKAKNLDLPDNGLSKICLSDAGKVNPLTAHILPHDVLCQWHTWAYICPEQDEELARSCNNRHSEIFRVEGTNSYGLQFHPEVSATKIGEYDSPQLYRDRYSEIASVGRRIIDRWLTTVIGIQG